MLSLFKIKINKNMPYKLYKLKSNLLSCFILSIVEMFFSLLLLLMNKQNTLIFPLSNPISIYILIVWICIWLLSYLYFYHFKNTNHSIILNLLYFLYLIPVFYLNTIMCFGSGELVFNLGRYTVFILTNCLFLLFSIPECIFLFLPMAILLYINVYIKYPQGELLYNLLFSIVLINIICFVYSIIKHNSSLKEFSTHMQLLDAINDRDDANDKLRTHEKYVTDFFINISHDLKAPLNIIYSCEQLLEKQIFDKNIDYPKAEKYITSIKLNSVRLTRLLNNVLDISKIDAAKYSLNLRNLDIVTTIEGIADSLLDFMNSKDIELSFDTDFEENILALDEEKLERIILNLLSNGLKFTPKGGKIFIRLYEDDNHVFVSIKDTGIGIDNDTQKNIFDRFVQGTITPPNNMSGSGIGLSLVKSLMFLHGGDVFLESKLGEGSNFTLSFPKKTLQSTLKDDISSGRIYPTSDTLSSTNLEFSGLVKDKINVGSNLYT